ncbi:RusA family crossover junction endodeoxyribonuclease [Dyadobacter jiangsuensis]|uniref:Crossover junction endodeoxyribonuclease RusA n=1 Tax=Dyadobacter jiangsuensis TaxID=1591085 RepID=A0A2P8FP33_9BACT|nr:RusA family crossover junction endodeoxyribonuclease [Dyadobacter jiangsuensis]PSL23453.1 crossover junction endodeoxyribonuclease RusA [Dyadobacter jiangsuensis]
MIIILPFPPSVNSLFGGGSKQKRFPSKKYKAWKAACPQLEAAGISTPVHIHYTFAWPCRRKRDGQSYFKAVTDYLVSQGVIADDNYEIVDSESWDHVGVDKTNPRVEIRITNK